MKHTALILLSSIVLLACGGGGTGNEASSNVESTNSTSSGGSNNDQSSSTQTQVDETTEQSDQGEANQTSSSAELQIDRNFGFEHQQNLTVTIVTPEIEQAQFFATICAINTVSTDSDIQADYSQCLWQGSLVNMNTQVQIVMPAHLTQLVAELWHIHQGEYQVQRLPLNFYDAAATAQF